MSETVSRLFRCEGTADADAAGIYAAVTPFGTVALKVFAGDTRLNVEETAQAYRLPSGGRLACWHAHPFDLELLTCRLTPSLSPGMDAEGCLAYLWRLRAHHDLPAVNFTAEWEAGYTWTDGSPNSGEHLYAKVYSDGVTELHIGTQDEEMLAWRASLCDAMPRRWEPHFVSSATPYDGRTIPFWNSPAHEELGNRGITIPLPPLNSGELCQIHFVIAWAEDSPAGQASWFAVDCPADAILTGCGCLA